MTPTGIQFIDSLRQEWSAGSVTRDAALDRLLPWEDDAATRTQDELEAAWALRQELEEGASALSQPEYVAEIGNVEGKNGASAPSTPAESPSVQSGAHEQEDTERQQMVADLRANPLLTRDDLLAAHAICARLVAAGANTGDEYIKARCDEVEAQVARHIETVHSAIEEASHTLHDAPGMEEKLQACDRIRDGLADIEILRPNDPTLPDMLAWCEQTRHELTKLLAERDLLMADVVGIVASEEVDAGLVESSKQRLIVLSDMQLSKDDLALRKAARHLTTRLTTFLSDRLQPGTGYDKEALNEYSRVLYLAKQAPEAISADQAKSYADMLAAAQAELARSEHASEPPTRATPNISTAPPPPPQPKTTSISQPNADSVQDGIHSQPDVAQSTTPLPHSTPGYRPVLPPPPPPRVQPGWSPASTQLTHPASNFGTTGQQTPGTPTTNILPPQHNTTVNLSPQYPQTTPIYAPPNTGPLGLSPAIWVAIGVGVATILIFLVVIIAVLASKGGPVNNPINGGGGGSSPRDVTLTFYRDLQAHDYDGAFKLLAPVLANQTDVNTLRGRTVILENREGSMQTIDVSNANETGDTAQTTATVTYASGNRSIDLVSLSKQGNSWLISNVTSQQ